MKSEKDSKKPQSRFQREKQWFINKKPASIAGAFLIGLIATIWFIIRVIPKPSRIHYPCMQMAAPFASSFVLYITGLLSGVFAWKKLTEAVQNSRYVTSIAFGLLLVCAAVIFTMNGSFISKASTTVDEPGPNEPVGTAKGIFPGRVVWVWNPQATDENCTNTPGDYWWQNQNNNQEAINQMVSNSIRKLTGTETDAVAWDSLFRYYNRTHGRGNHGYIAGEKIAIKVNITTGYAGNVNDTTYEKTACIDYMDGTPQMMLAFLQQLVENAGVPQNNISMGDPSKLFYDHNWDVCHAAYPSVKYLDWFGKAGRTRAVASAAPVLIYSDGEEPDSIPQAYIDASYMINISCLKQHDCAGGTFCAKNHFGSICRDLSGHLHYSLPSPNPDLYQNPGYGKYRNLVDLMEHKDLGLKTMLFVIDGLWGGDRPVCTPKKWQMNPFNNDWPNSLFVSQDHVAIESVGFDFVRAEFPVYSHMSGADDYLLQAADSANWSEGITYNPDADNQLIASMGVYERWNNNTDKQYTRNLGTGNGIELLKDFFTGIEEPGPATQISGKISCYPNPIVSSAVLKITGIQPSENDVIMVLDSKHQLVSAIKWNSTDSEQVFERQNLKPGMYFMYLKTDKAQHQAFGRIIIAN